MSIYNETLKALNTTKATMVDVIKYVGITYGKKLTYSEEYANGTGYLDALAYVELEEGFYNMVDEYDRAVLIIATNKGNLVLFQRHTDNQNVVVYNAPRELKPLLRLSGLNNVADKFALNNLIGDSFNICFNDCPIILATK